MLIALTYLVGGMLCGAAALVLGGSCWFATLFQRDARDRRTLAVAALLGLGGWAPFMALLVSVKLGR